MPGPPLGAAQSSEALFLPVTSGIMPYISFCKGGLVMLDGRPPEPEKDPAMLTRPRGCSESGGIFQGGGMVEPILKAMVRTVTSPRKKKDQEQKIVFSVDGCGIIGANGQLIVRDGDDNAILFIHKKEGVVQALSVNNWWRGYLTDYGQPSKLVFSLQDPKPVLCMKGDVRVIVEPNRRKRHWDYEVTGSFVQRFCAIKSRAGHVVAQIGVKGMMAGKDFYQVVVQPGYDQAFVVGIIAILDNMHGESTRC